MKLTVLFVLVLQFLVVHGIDGKIVDGIPLEENDQGSGAVGFIRSLIDSVAERAVHIGEEGNGGMRGASKRDLAKRSKRSRQVADVTTPPVSDVTCAPSRAPGFIFGGVLSPTSALPTGKPTPRPPTGGKGGKGKKGRRRTKAENGVEAAKTAKTTEDKGAA